MTELEKDLYELVALALKVIVNGEEELAPIFIAKAEKTLSKLEF